MQTTIVRTGQADRCVGMKRKRGGGGWSERDREGWGETDREGDR